MWTADVRAALTVGALMTVICGGLYPLAITAAAQVIAPEQASGSVIVAADGRAVGSALVAQPFTQPRYLWPRPSFERCCVDLRDRPLLFIHNSRFTIYNSEQARCCGAL